MGSNVLYRAIGMEISEQIHYKKVFWIYHEILYQKYVSTDVRSKCKKQNKQTKKREKWTTTTIFNELHRKISNIMVNKNQSNHNKTDIKESLYMKLKNKHN